MFDEATWAAVAERVRLQALRSVNDPDDAQDLAQESVHAALQQGRLSSRSDLMNFCMGVLRRQLAAYYRHKQYWRVVPLENAVEPRVDPDPIVALAERDVMRRAAALAAHLGPEERVLLGLLLKGWSRHQLAERLGVTRSRLRQRYHRLVQKLRRWDRESLNRLGGVA
ncbi:MAG: sigma-70 family RNA polymerase sigma factor [Acidobacteria bacterium]|nr:sigma-70 family RNA polymerase sigma factor [Acidobacteriota bacterium]MBI3657737.1 sigma-70 family RNA polymerase sigma factor [Acidobacteriota bacterium]